MWIDLATGPKIALIIAGVICLAVVVGFVMHWVKLWKLRK